MRARHRPAGRFTVACIVIAAATAITPRHHRAGAQEVEVAPAVLTTLGELLPQGGDDPIVAEFLITPGEAGSVAEDPASDVWNFGENQEGEAGPDLLGFSWFTVPAGPLAEGFGTLVTTEPRPDEATLYGQDGWVVPAPDTTLVAFIAEFDRTVSVSLPDACVVALNARLPGPTTPEDRVITRDPNKDTNRSYQLAGWDTLPTYATEADTSTPDFSTVDRESSLFGALVDNQAILFIPLSELEDVGAFRMSIKCAASDDVGMTQDMSDLVPFDSTSLGVAYFGPASALPAPTTTTTMTTTTTTVTAPASTAPDESGGGDGLSDADASAGDGGSDSAVGQPTGSSDDDPTSSDGLIGTWALVAGLIITAAGGWVLYRSPLRTPDQRRSPMEQASE